jgi:hypothetical protein
MNPTLFKKVSGSDTRTVSRWFAGGQGLRAGDADPSTLATVGNCCFPCLEAGCRVAETVWHVLFHCANTAPARNRAAAEGITSLCDDVFFHHRDRWSWPQLRAIRRWVVAAEALQEGAQPHEMDRAEILDELWGRTD